MSLILPPSSSLGGRRSGFGSGRPYLKVFGAFLAGAVIAGAAIKWPTDSAATADGKAPSGKPTQVAGDAKPAKAAAPAKVAAAPEAAPKDKAPAKVQAAPAQAVDASAQDKASATPPASSKAPELAGGPASTPPAAASSAPALAEAADETVRLGEDAAAVPGAVPVPTPPVRPAVAARPVPVPAAPAQAARPAPAREAAPVVAATDPTPDVAEPAPTKRQRIVVRKRSRPERVQTARAEPQVRDEPAVYHERARRVFERERPIRDDRFRSLQARNEAEGFSLVRSRVLPDGRRVSVYRRYDEPPARVMAFEVERRPMIRLPFGMFP